MNHHSWNSSVFFAERRIPSPQAVRDVHHQSESQRRTVLRYLRRERRALIAQPPMLLTEAHAIELRAAEGEEDTLLLLRLLGTCHNPNRPAAPTFEALVERMAQLRVEVGRIEHYLANEKHALLASPPQGWVDVARGVCGAVGLGSTGIERLQQLDTAGKSFNHTDALQEAVQAAHEKLQRQTVDVLAYLRSNAHDLLAGKAREVKRADVLALFKDTQIGLTLQTEPGMLARLKALDERRKATGTGPFGDFNGLTETLTNDTRQQIDTETAMVWHLRRLVRKTGLEDDELLREAEQRVLGPGVHSVAQKETLLQSLRLLSAQRETRFISLAELAKELRYRDLAPAKDFLNGPGCSLLLTALAFDVTDADMVCLADAAALSASALVRLLQSLQATGMKCNDVPALRRVIEGLKQEELPPAVI